MVAKRPGPDSPSEVERQSLVLLSTFATGEHSVLDALCAFIFRSFRGVIPFDRLCVALIEGDPAVVRMRWQASVLAGPPLPSRYALPLGETSLGAVAQGGEPRILNDLGGYLEQHPGSRSSKMVHRQGVRSSLTCPLRVEGVTLGFLFFSSHQPDQYSEGHCAVFSDVADDLALVVKDPAPMTEASMKAVRRLGTTLENLSGSVRR
ncbi:MAG: GAF domain-containing protein [Deltaproteobacteria bacterium]|nr:GAF domain-containing protein [Deltaproteobacteria bacterium]